MLFTNFTVTTTQGPHIGLLVLERIDDTSGQSTFIFTGIK